MAENGRWFKLWTDALDDQVLDNLPLDSFGRWAKFGAYLKKHGNAGEITLTAPARTLCSMFQLPDFDAVISAIKQFPNVQISIVSSETNINVSFNVKWDNWLKYQGDWSTPRVKKFRVKNSENETPKKRREEKRKEEKRNICDLHLKVKESFRQKYPKRNGKIIWVGFDKQLQKIKESDIPELLKALDHYSNSKMVRDGIGIKDPARFLWDGKNKVEFWREWIEPEFGTKKQEQAKPPVNMLDVIKKTREEFERQQKIDQGKSE